jgi:hypothetical protein
MRHPSLIAAVVLLSSASAGRAQTDPVTKAAAPKKVGGERPFIPFGSNRFGLDLTLIQPGGFFYLDKGRDDPGEVDIFKDGKMTIAVQLAGADIGGRFQQNAVRAGGNFGFGVATAGIAEYCRTGAALDTCPAAERVAATTGGVLIYNTGLFVQLRDLMRFEAGRIQGISGIENLDRHRRDDAAWYFGVTFNTKIGDVLENLIRGDQSGDTANDAAGTKTTGKSGGK